ncbi:MAG: STAS domain-containing protein [Verrucomicrobiota bacterium]
MKPSLSQENAVLTLTVPGDLVSTTAPAVREAARPLLEPGAGAAAAWRLVRLDLAAASMVDSVGLNLIVTLFKAAQRSGAKMQLLYKDPNVHRTLLFTRLDKHLELLAA